METVTVRMARGDRNQPWGFGVTEAPNRDTVIVSIVGGSLAERAGLRNGDIILELEGLKELDINAIDRLLVTSRDKIELIVTRAAGGQSRLWRPEITENPNMRAVFTGNPPPVEDRPYKVSLEHHSESRAPQGFNTAAAPFDADPRVKHLQYNSPMGLYSQQNVEESYRQQTAGLSGQSGQQQTGGPQQPGYLQSETLRLIKEQDNRGNVNAPASLSTHPNPSGLPVCFVCTRPILGVMAKAAGQNIHGDCLSCATCGNSLRNVGHHFIDSKFYCEIHGRQKKGLGPIQLDPNLAVRSSPTAAQPVRKDEGIRGFYQPDVLSRRPVSPGVTSATTALSQLNVHVSNPKTHGNISPSNRGVPTNPNYGGAGSYTSYGGAADQQQHHLRPVSPRPMPVISAPPPAPVIAAAAPPPPVPSNPPPGTVAPSTPSLSLSTSQDSRVPSSVRDAVSPRRAVRAPRPWPPPDSGAVKNRYWQIDPAGAGRKEKEPQPCDLKELIRMDEKGAGPKSAAKAKNRQRRQQSEISTGDVRKGFRKMEEMRREKEAQKEPQQMGDIFPQGVHGYAPQGTEETSNFIPIAPEPVQTGSLELQPIVPAPEINSGIHWTVITGPKSPTPGQQEASENVTQIRIEEPPAHRGVPLKQPQATSSLLQEPERVDSSTSPIPVIRFERQKSLEQGAAAERPPRMPTTSSPTPFQSPKVERRATSPPEIRISARTELQLSRPTIELNECTLIGVNTAPKPFGFSTGGARKVQAKPLKKVDFSKAQELIPSPVWEAEVLDESDMLTVTSRTSQDSEEDGTPRISYDADESIRSDEEEEEEMDEQERWMKEELELAMKEELEMKKLEGRWKEPAPPPAEEVDWKEQAAALLGDEEQSERDLAVVAALHDRLNDLREMEDTDRQRAIECIERHQKALEEQQEQLAGLLQSAITYLRAMEPAEGGGEVAPTPPPRNSSIVKTDSLTSALEELDAIKLSPGEKIAKELEKVQTGGSQSFSRSTFEKTSTTTSNGLANGSARGGGVSSHNTSTFGGRIPYCEACKQQIKGAFVLATGLAWCPEHFVCANRSCGRRLLECGFVEENGQKYCEGCFEAHIAPRCAKCAKPITSDCLNALHKKWHPTCFTCAHCHKPFGNSAFYLENGQAYCEKDWNQLFTTKCVSCKYPIEAGDRWVEALGSAFHSNCFNCSRCHTNLEGESFYAKNGQPFCKLHA